MQRSKTKFTQLLTAAVLACTLASPTNLVKAATPPARINYQGVLRNAAGDPLNGSYDMTFKFYSLDTGGVEILTDTRATIMPPGGPVIVTNGLFNAILGDGVVADGSGPGTYTSLAQVFRDYGVVWLEIKIGAETLAPRVQITASAYALNASNLEGKPASSFLDTSAADQTKAGTLTVYSGNTGWAVTAAGRDGGVRAYDSLGGAGLAEIGYRDYGVRVYGKGGTGNGMPGWFKDTQGTGEAWIAPGNNGLYAFGTESGGVFRRGTPSAYTDEAILANAGAGVTASGFIKGGYFSNPTSSAALATGSEGVSAVGRTGGVFYGDTQVGVNAIGLVDGGNFYGNEYGVKGRGSEGGGEFRSADTSRAYAGVALGIGWGTGIQAEGYGEGGFFRNMADPNNYTYLATSDRGITARGAQLGGFFTNAKLGAAIAYLGSTWAIDGYGTFNSGAGGANFHDYNYTGHSQLARGDVGIVSYGTYAAGVFRHGTESGWDNWAHLADGSSSITGVGAKNFVQNHPYDPESEVVYTALEGDEVGTYTRGSARFEHGVARVKLSPSFAWVTNPDIGLTATVTPRGVPVPVAVESVSTTELVVRAGAGAHEVAFDYVVQGLRAGFENATVVRPKRDDAPIPSMAEHAKVYAAHPELRQYNAMERFAGGKPVDLSRSDALIAAIGQGDLRQPPSRRGSLLTEEHAAKWELDHPGKSLAEMEARVPDPAEPERLVPLERPSGTDATPPAARRSESIVGAQAGEANSDADSLARGRLIVVLPGDGSVRPFDLVTAEGRTDGAVTAASKAADRAAVGLALQRRQDGSVDVIVGGMGMLRVDATYGAISTGDLLTASATPGHAMRSPDAAPGTVVAKALEPLDAGTGVIRVLVVQR